MKIERWEWKTKPTVQRYWFAWYPQRTNHEFWWRVGLEVKRRRVRHKNKVGVLRVCEYVNEHFPPMGRELER